MSSSTNTQRRRFLAGLAAGGAALALPGLRAATPSRVVVLTAYPDETVSRFERAFEQAYPQYRLQIVWRMPHDALPYLQQPGQSGVDVYWSASPRTFAALADAGAWRRLKVNRDGLPDHIGRAALADPEGRYLATEMAGFGFAVNDAALERRNLQRPADWPDLTDARYAGLVALPVPARVGFAPPMVEIVLQSQGWDAGWALWSEIAGNAAMVDRGSTFVTDEVADGRLPIGLSIDFFVASAIANGAPLGFVYPRHGGINPAHVAVTAGAPNPEGALAFAGFVLSEAGQRLLTHPDIRKLPVRPSVYDGLPPDYYNPFAAAARGAFDYDSEAARPRLGLSAALFQQMLVENHAQVVDLWRRIHAAETAGRNVAEARAILGRPVLSEAEAADPELRRLFHRRVEGDDSAVTSREAQWRRRAGANLAAARRLLDNAGV